MNYICTDIKGPYDGPFSSNIISFFLTAEDGTKAVWHQGPNKALNCKKGDSISGIILNEKQQINYKLSSPKIIQYQLSLF